MGRRGTGRQAAPRRFVEELHGFLSLEAPFLIPEIRVEASEAELETRLLEAVERGCRPRRGFADRELYPGLSHRQAADWRREDLTLLVRGFFARQRLKASIGREERVLMYRTMLLTRAVDQVLKRAFDRKTVHWGEYPSPQKGFRSTGQEAIVGAALRLRRGDAYGAGGDDYRGDIISPLIRDLGALLMFMPDPEHPMRVQFGKAGTPVGGRDLHYGDYRHGVMPPAAPLAIAAQTLTGIAYAFKLRGEDRVCVSFIGEGGSSLGEWHEAINFAAVQRLPHVFLVQNNHWALGTHVSEQSAAHRFAAKAAGYGIPGITVFGNDPDEIAAAVAWSAERARQGEGPTLVELVSYRRAGHAHHDDDRFHGNPEAGIPGYEDPEERHAWEAVDPLALYASRLQGLGILWARDLSAMEQEIEAVVAEAEGRATAAAWPSSDDYRGRVFAPSPAPPPSPAPTGAYKRLAYDEAVRQALVEMMREDDGVFVLGEDVGGRYGGAFGVTRGLVKEFGPSRCLNTPLAESAIVGCAVGAALEGLRPVAEIQFADFLAPGFNALVNNAAKIHWRWGRPVPLVVRLPYGGATGTLKRLLGGGPFHSQCPEMWFVRTPGWKVVAPATPADAKGLLIAAIRDDNPVIYLEAKGLYGFFRTDLREEVPLGPEHEVPIGRACVRRAGDDLTLVSYGAMVWTALEAAEKLAEEGVSVEVLDLRSLVPLDEEALCESVARTNRLLVVHEDSRRGGFGAEIAALVADRMFFHLDVPVRTVAAPDTPVPYAPPLEHDFLPKTSAVVAAVRELLRT